MNQLASDRRLGGSILSHCRLRSATPLLLARELADLFDPEPQHHLQFHGSDLGRIEHCPLADEFWLSRFIRRIVQARALERMFGQAVSSLRARKSRRLTFNLLHQPRRDAAVSNSDDRETVIPDYHGDARSSSGAFRDQVMARDQVFQLKRVAGGKMIGVANLLRDADLAIRVERCFHGRILHATEGLVNWPVFRGNCDSSTNAGRTLAANPKSIHRGPVDRIHRISFSPDH